MSSLRVRALALVGILCGGAQALAAQTVEPGALVGTVMDSVHHAGLIGARVSLTRLGISYDFTRFAITDSLGHFKFERLVPGSYAVDFESPLLESLEVGGTARPTSIAANATAIVDLAIPSSATLRNMACPGVAFPARMGALVGVITDADSEQPIAGAEVVAAWSEHTADSSTGSLAPELRTARVTSDASGQYRMCGVTTGEWLLVQVQRFGRAGSAIRTTMADAVGVAVLNLSFSGATSFTLASAAGDMNASPAPQIGGSAALTGIVRDGAGNGLSGVDVRVLSTAAFARTNDRGEYLLTSLPAGTQELEVRQLGFAILRRPVELRNDRRMRHDVRLDRVVSLDSIRVKARRSSVYAEFETRRRESIDGKFLTETDIVRVQPKFTSDIVYLNPSFRVLGQGPDAKIISSRGGLQGNCETLIVIDDIEAATINEVSPPQIAAMELYPATAGAPFKHKSKYGCGTIMIWTKR
ncbi:hypothetical protein BH11GEM2_BH11GEM2_17680 [soil metagenome]